MIAYVFLALGAAGTAGVLYAVAPAGRGVHRYVVPRSQLRAEAARSTAVAEELACKLRGLASELDGVYEELDCARDERDNALADKEKAEDLAAELREQLREADGLREANRALKAQLANARRVTPLPPHGATLPPDARVMPLHQAPFAVNPAPRPN
ncbi:hypothetical protein [Streptomyces blattellae]|uniref:hypothetical protein n=1 Tax=Streptomyces blattellae TaxID=2569855 RepID=UPI0012B9B7A0|nr:hypothetical protein [Streptomyces blattellae]